MKKITSVSLNTIMFTNLDYWDVKRYTGSPIQSKYSVKPLGLYIIERNEKVKPFLEPDAEFSILGVNNKIGLFDAYVERGCNINQPYKAVHVNDLAYNPYRINVGSIGIKTMSHKHNYISPAYVVFYCNNELLADFLFILFKSNTFNKIINENTTGAVRQNLKFDILYRLHIPIPPLHIQEKLILIYNEKLKISSQLEAKSKQLENEIEEYLFNILGIEKNVKKIKKRGLNFVKFQYMDNWGIDNLLTDTQGVLKSKKYPNKKLSSLYYVNPRADLSHLNDEDLLTFIPMTSISDNYGEIIEHKLGRKHDIKGYTKFQENDLIWARITPCMQNGKSAIARDLINKFGYGSTEFHVIRQKSEMFKIDYVYHLLRTKVVRNNAISYFTGSAGQQRVPKSYLENLDIPTPPLKIQIKIVEKISEIKSEIKRVKQDSIRIRKEALKEFEKEIFKI